MSDSSTVQPPSAMDLHARVAHLTEAVVDAYARMINNPEGAAFSTARQFRDRVLRVQSPSPDDALAHAARRTGFTDPRMLSLHSDTTVKARPDLAENHSRPVATDQYLEAQEKLRGELQEQAEANPALFLRTTAALMDAHANTIEVGNNLATKGHYSFVRGRLGDAAQKMRRAAITLGGEDRRAEPLPTKPLNLDPRPTEAGKTLRSEDKGYERGVEFLSKVPAYHLIAAANALASDPERAEELEGVRHATQAVVSASAAALAHDATPELNPVLQQLSMGQGSDTQFSGKDMAEAVLHRIEQNLNPLSQTTPTPRPGILPGSQNATSTQATTGKKPSLT